MVAGGGVPVRVTPTHRCLNLSSFSASGGCHHPFCESDRLVGKGQHRQVEFRLLDGEQRRHEAGDLGRAVRFDERVQPV